MSSLKELHDSMRLEGIHTQRFIFSPRADLRFECLFSDLEKPYSLALSHVGTPFFILLSVTSKYDVDINLPNEEYKQLAALLRTHGQSFSPFKPSVFFQQLNTAIPRCASVARVPSAQETARIRRDIEENDRIYFWRWVVHTNKKVTESNLHKTLLLMGAEAAQYSREHNASSCWTDRPMQNDA